MVLALNITSTHCEFYQNLDFDSETSCRQPVALKASVFSFYLWNSIDHFCFWSLAFSTRYFVEMLVIS